MDQLLFRPVVSQERAQGGETDLSCRNAAMESFRKELPVLRIQWLLNGEPLKVQPSRMLFKGETDLTITARNLITLTRTVRILCGARLPVTFVPVAFMANTWMRQRTQLI